MNSYISGRQIASHVLLSSLPLLLLLSCRAPAGPCEVTQDCLDSEVCVEALCRRACNTDRDCAVGDECRDGACLPIEAPPSRDDTQSDAGGLDAASGLDHTAGDTLSVDVDPCLTAVCPENSTCVALDRGGYICSCGDDTCEDFELCLFPEPAGYGTTPRCCLDSQLNCRGRCVDFYIDEANCGACEQPCAWGEECRGAVCNCGANPGCDALSQDCCSGVCADVLSDPDGCGPLGSGVGCGLSCEFSGLCVDGRCACQSAGDCAPGQECCDATYCADVQSDTDNCGSCGLTCRPGELCLAGTCACGPSCDDGDLCTEDRCVDDRCEHATLDGDDDGFCHSNCPDSESGAPGD